MRVEYREEPCRSALNRVKGMPFEWSLNPYMGCAHRCTFCYVRAFELRADRPADDRYGRSIRVKTNVAEVLARELARPSWRGEGIAIGAATDPYQPCEGRYRLTRSLPRGARIDGEPVLADHARADGRPRSRRPPGGELERRGLDHVLGSDPRRRGLANDGARHRAAAPAPPRAEGARRRRREGERRDGADPAGALRPARAARRGRQGGARGGSGEHLGEPALPEAGNPGALPRGARPRLAGGARALRAALRGPRLPPGRRDPARPRAGASAGARATASAIAGRRSPLRRRAPSS